MCTLITEQINISSHRLQTSLESTMDEKIFLASKDILRVREADDAATEVIAVSPQASTCTIDEFLAMAKSSRTRLPHRLEAHRPTLAICDIHCDSREDGNNSDPNAVKLIMSMHAHQNTISAKFGGGPISYQSAVNLFCAARPQYDEKVHFLEDQAKQLDQNTSVHAFPAQLPAAESETSKSNVASESDDEDDNLYVCNDSTKFYAQSALRPDGTSVVPASQQSAVGSIDSRQ